MKKTERILFFSMINNLIIAIIKIIGGFVFKLNSLFADGMHTFCDFFTDIVSIVVTRIQKKKSTKHHPFGFGMVEYISNIFIGFILLMLSIIIGINAFNKEVVIPPLSSLYLILVVFVLKFITIHLMYKEGKKSNSQLLFASVEESKTDLYSTIGVFIITILLQFSNDFNILKYSDVIGTLIIALIILRTALKILISNTLSVIGETDENEELKGKIKELIYKNKKVKNDKITLIKYGSYFKLDLIIELDKNITLNQISKLERDLKITIIRHRSLNIKYVNIYVTDKI